MPDIDSRLDRLTYLLEEIREERQHQEDLLTNRELLFEDFKAIIETPNTRSIKLYVNYFGR